MPIEIGELLDQGPWPRFAKLATLLFAIAIIFDGFDINVVGFAVPSIIQDWHLPRAAFAPLLVIGLVGMTVGSMSAGFIGDRIGRRVALSLSVLLFGLAVAASAVAPNLLTIEILRFIAAAGIGGALPNAATMSAEFTPVKMRTIAVMSTIICVPLGGALAGSVAAAVLPVSGWRALFLIGGALPILLSLGLFWLVPESPRFLSRHPERAPELIRLLSRLGHDVPPDTTFVESVADRTGPGMAMKDFFGPGRTRSTFSLWLTFFASGTCVYMCFSWLPTLLSAHGLGLAGASQGLAAWNYGGVAGVLCFVLLVNRFGSRVLTLTVCLLAARLFGVAHIGRDQTRRQSSCLAGGAWFLCQRSANQPIRRGRLSLSHKSAVPWRRHRFGHDTHRRNSQRFHRLLDDSARPSAIFRVSDGGHAAGFRRHESFAQPYSQCWRKTRGRPRLMGGR